MKKPTYHYSYENDFEEYAEECEIKYHKPQGYYTEKEAEPETEPIDRYNQEEGKWERLNLGLGIRKENLWIMA